MSFFDVNQSKKVLVYMNDFLLTESVIIVYLKIENFVYSI